LKKDKMTDLMYDVEEANKEHTITLLQGDVDRIIMALEEWGEGDDIVKDLEKYASAYMSDKE